MAPPRHQGKFFGRGETYLIGAVINPADPEAETFATWELSPAVAFREVDPATMVPERKGLHYISFVATPDLQSATVTATATINGLPTRCKNTATVTFKIEFDSESPREIAKFPRKLPRNLEEANLNILAVALRDADDSVIVLIVIDYSKKDTKKALRKYVDRISRSLIDMFHFPQDKFSFAFNPKNEGSVIAFGWPREREHSWETDIERLEIPD